MRRPAAAQRQRRAGERALGDDERRRHALAAAASPPGGGGAVGRARSPEPAPARRPRRPASAAGCDLAAWRRAAPPCAAPWPRAWRPCAARAGSPRCRRGRCAARATTLKMKIHSSASRPSRSRVRVSSLIRHRRPGDAERGRRAAEGDAVTVLQALARDAVSVDERAVGGVEVADRRDEVRPVGRHADLAVAPRDSGVVDDDVGGVVATEGRQAAEQGVAVAGDVEPRPGGGVAARGRPGRHRPLVDGRAGARARCGGTCGLLRAPGRPAWTSPAARGRRRSRGPRPRRGRPRGGRCGW